jgi:hypothetical protein
MFIEPFHERVGFSWDLGYFIECLGKTFDKKAAHPFFDDGFGRDAIPSMAHRPVAENTVSMAMAYR